MKRTALSILIVFSMLLMASGLHAQTGFSNPILVGGDNPSTTAADNQRTNALFLKFFDHPEVPVGKNFSDPTGELELPGSQMKVYIGDIMASPGVASGSSVKPAAELLDAFGPRDPQAAADPLTQSLDPVYGVGPDDLVDVYGDIAGLDLQIYRGNVASHRLLLGDVREEETSGEFLSLFGTDPLEEGLIGDAAEEAPYAPETYPAPIVLTGDPKFQWCAVPKFFLPLKGFGDACSPVGSLGPNTYEEIFLYDGVDIGNGMISASYDPFLLKVQSAEYSKNIMAAGLYGDTIGILNYAYSSPLALFRKDLAASPGPRYRFSGYTSWEMPDMTNAYPFWPFIFTNWIMPIAANPISVEAMDFKFPAPSADRDRDIAVTYQNTLFDLDEPLYNIFGRPAIYGDDKMHTLRELMGTCSNPSSDPWPNKTCPQNAFVPLQDQKDLFPDHVIALALGWWQEEKWFDGSGSQDYATMNPSHIYEPIAAAIVGPGMYDTAVLTDFDTDPAKRRQYLLAPSGCPESECKNGGIVYLIDPNEPLVSQIWFKSLGVEYEEVPGQSIGGATTAFECTALPPTFIQTPLLAPRAAFRYNRPTDGDGYVPYEVSSGNLDNDPCEDFILTWRGSKTIKDKSDPNNAFEKFDDGTGRMFSNRITIQLRNDDGTGTCVFTKAAEQEAKNIPLYIDVQGNGGEKPQIASAALGDFDGDNIVDIVAGNQTPEGSGADKTVYAYFFSGKNFSSLNEERIRVGFKAGDDVKGGVAKIVADTTQKPAPQAIGAANGLPLMLPPIGCPDYNNPDDPTVQSAFETYISMIHNFMSKWAYNTGFPGAFKDPFPFVDTALRPQPHRCAEPRGVCKIAPLPLYADDPCCVDVCGMKKQDWLDTCAPYLAKQAATSCGIFDYLQAWNNTNCFMKMLPVPKDNMEIIEEKFKPQANALDEGAGSNIASRFQPDQVIGAPQDTIALKSALVQSGDIHEEVKTPIAGQIDQSSDYPEVHFEGPLDRLLKKLIDEGLPLEVAEMLGKDERSKLEHWLLEVFPAAPLSLEDYFLQGIVAGALIDLDAQELILKHESALEKSLLPVVHGETSALRSPREDLSQKALKLFTSAVDAVTGFFVAEAGAQTCDAADACNTSVCKAPLVCKEFAGSPTGYQCQLPNCGDGCVTPPELCDIGSPQNDCGLGLICKKSVTPSSATCSCVAYAPQKFDDIRLPKGRLMPGHHEVTAIVRKTGAQQSLCNPPDGKKDPGEECDLWNVPLSTPNYQDLVDAHCDPDPILGPAKTCTTFCECFYDGDPDNYDGGEPSDGGEPGEPEITLSSNNDCVCRCDSFSSEVELKIYEGWNDEIRAASGLKGDLLCEPEQTATCICRIDAAAAPSLTAADISLSLSGDPLPDSSLNVRPYALIQRSGSKFNDSSTLYYMEFEEVTDPLLLLPNESAAAKAGKAVVLPQLSSGLASIAVPMETTSVSLDPNGNTVIINNMVEHNLFAIGPGQQITISGIGTQLGTSSTSVPSDTATLIHRMKYRIPPDCGSWTAVEGYKGCPPIEDRMLSLPALTDEFTLRQSQLPSGSTPSQQNMTGNLPWDAHLNYQFTLGQAVYAKAGDPVPTPVEMNYTFLAGRPLQMGRGGGCNCQLESAPMAMGDMLPWLIFGVLPMGGLIATRIRKRRK